ncbi:HEAT repeat domain-containing protein [Thiolinea disciformis]|uniref:HEAT repeat domain-containing protein n=1 Tax=Thiolinea disciformis TaxID=125614 RepID=UPI00035F569E|nr:HEAT repeat domain-containing protein [Thiolinea disciformis]
MPKLTSYPRWLIHEQNLQTYYNSLLLSGEAPKVAKLIQQNPENFAHLIKLLTTKGLPLSSRMGIGVVMEELAGTAVLENHIHLLLPLTQEHDARLRADACYYLELSGNPVALSTLQACLQDTDPSVREMAQDAIIHLKRLMH